MKNLLHASVLLLFLVVVINADLISNISTTTTIAPIPSTISPSNATSSNNTAAIKYDYYVCGNETKVTDCTCINATIECKPSRKDDYWYWYASMNPPFKSMNIQILNESFIPKNVTFHNNKINKLLKNKVLPGHEHTVQNLKLTSNEIKEIENGTFDKFISLKILDLRYNFLPNITAGVFTKELGSTLTTLKIADNAFDSMTSIDFSNMEKLEELDLSHNGHIGFNQTEFSKYIFPKSLANLKILDFSYCRIEMFGDEIFVNLINLETLKLNDNPLIALPKSFNALTNLQNLDMGFTHLSLLNFTMFQNLSNLQTFEISYSLLEKIDDCTFCNKPNLKSVMLYLNRQLTYIHENAFGNILNGTSPPLESFSLESCNLSIIPENLLNWYTVKEFGLGDNPFACNCSMAWLINDILMPIHSINMKSFLSRSGESEFKCYYPFVLRGTPFTHISQKLCPIEPKKEEPQIVKDETSMATVFLFVVTFIFAFVLGIAAVHFYSFLKNRRILPTSLVPGFVNQNFGDERNVEDFDEVKSYY